jgi:hypothetical protein
MGGNARKRKEAKEAEHVPGRKPTADEILTGIRRKEWVTLENGVPVCVWEMTVAESAQLAEFSQRPDALGGTIDMQEALIWQIALVSFDGDEEGVSRRIFPDSQVTRIKGMRHTDFQRIVHASARVNGSEAERLEDLQSFTKARPEEPSSS